MSLSKKSFSLFAVAAGLAGGMLSRADAPESGYDPPPFSAYQPILDRMPFGPLPANFSPNGAQPDAAALKTEAEVKMEQTKLAQQVKLSCVNISPDGGTMVGFSVLDGKNQIPLYLEVGDSRDGWEVVDADYDKEWAKIKKDGVEITMKLGRGLVDSQSVASKSEAPAPPPAARSSAGRSRLFSRLLSSRRRSSGTPFRGLRPRDEARAAAHSGLARPGASRDDARRSFTERLKERARKLSAEQAARERENQARLEKMAEKAAAAALARQKEEEAAAAEEELRLRSEQGE